MGRIPNGAIVERAIKSPFMQGDYVRNLNRPDFTTAKRLEQTINDLVGPDSAQAIDAASVRVLALRDASQRVAYLSTPNLEFKPADTTKNYCELSHRHNSDWQKREATASGDYTWWFNGHHC